FAGQEGGAIRKANSRCGSRWDRADTLRGGLLRLSRCGRLLFPVALFQRGPRHVRDARRAVRRGRAGLPQARRIAARRGPSPATLPDRRCGYAALAGAAAPRWESGVPGTTRPTLAAKRRYRDRVPRRGADLRWTAWCVRPR